MLEGVKAESRDGGGIGMSENAEDATFLVQAVGLQLAPEIVRPVRLINHFVS